MAAASDRDFCDLTDKLGPADLQHLFHKLGISQVDIEHAEESEKLRDTRLKARAVLRKWKESKGKEATREALLEAKSKISCTTDQPSDVTTWQKQLKAIYKTKRGGIRYIPGVPKEFSSDEFFVELELVEKGKISQQVKHVELKTYTDLLELKSTQGKSLDHVLVSGLAGTGKTTLISRLAYQWATFHESGSQFYKGNSTSDSSEEPSPRSSSESHDFLGNFQLVFALDIRKFQPDQDLIDVVKEHLLHNVSKEKLGNYLSCYASSCLFLFDGYDEIGSNTKILSNNMICGCHTIVTTRPNEANDFNDKHAGYVQVSLEGFSHSSIKKFVGSFFKLSDNQTGSEEECFLKALENNETIYNLSQFPLMLAMMCVLWKQEKSLPSSVAVLYKKVIEYLVRHWKTRELSKTSISQFKKQVGLDDVLLQLGETALHGLVNNNSQLIFEEEDFDSLDTIEKGCILGLMTKDCTLNEFDMVTNVSFIHKTFQEYCAAFYLASLVQSNPDLCNTYLSKMDIRDKDYVLKFSCGMNENAAKVVLSFVVDQSCKWKEHMKEAGGRFGIGCGRAVNDEDPWRHPLILLFEAESQFGFNKSLHELLIPLVSSTTFMNKPIYHDSEYLSILQHYKQMSDAPHAWLGFVQEASIYISDMVYKLCLPALMLTSLPNLHVLNVKVGEPADFTSVVLKIQKKMTSHSIEVLDFDDNCACDVATIKAFLDTQPNLTTLSIPRQPCPYGRPPNVTILGQVLQEICTRSGSITKITLKGNRANNDLSIQNVCSHICHSLEGIVTQNTSITPAGIQTIYLENSQ